MKIHNKHSYKILILCLLYFIKNNKFMKRELFNINTYIEWLKSINCVFYVAFDDKTGTTDLINNVKLTLHESGNISFNASKNMYEIITPSNQGNDIGYWSNGISNTTTFQSNNFTTLHTVQKITNINGKGIHTITPYSNHFRTCQTLDPNYNATGNTTSWPESITKVAYVHDYTNSKRICYQNGVKYGEYSLMNAFIPSNWQTLGSGICLARTPIDNNTSYQNVSLYIGELYIFNTVLDLKTIKEIQNRFLERSSNK